MSEYKTYSETILNRLISKIEEKEISRKDLADKIGCSASALTKMLTGKSDISLEKVHAIAHILGADLSMILAEGKNVEESIDDIHKTFRNDDYDSFVFSPERRSFRGILNEDGDDNDVYYFYTKPTISSERASFLRGTLKFTSEENNLGNGKYCKAVLKLYTGKQCSGEPDYKVYTGELVVSLPMGCAYAILIGKETAEINLITFSHMFLIHDKLACRLVACQTVSAGGHKRPVQSRAIISRYELNEKDLDILEGQLFMNSSRILVKSSKVNEHPESEQIRKRLAQIDCEEYTYMSIEENSIRALRNLSKEEKDELICKLRAISEAPVYTKVSTHADDILYNYIRTFVMDRH